MLLKMANNITWYHAAAVGISYTKKNSVGSWRANDFQLRPTKRLTLILLLIFILLLFPFFLNKKKTV